MRALTVRPKMAYQPGTEADRRVIREHSLSIFRLITLSLEAIVAVLSAGTVNPTVYPPRPRVPRGEPCTPGWKRTPATLPPFADSHTKTTLSSQDCSHFLVDQN